MTYTYPAGTGKEQGGPAATSSSPLQVTAAAGRIAVGLEMAAAVAGLAVAIL